MFKNYKIEANYIILILFVFIAACSPSADQALQDRYSGKKIDDDLGLTKDQYKEFFDRYNFKKYADRADTSIDDIEPIIAEPTKPMLKKDKLASLSVNNDVDVKDILIELARLAEIDIEIDPNVKGNIILKVTDKPLTEVIDRVCELAGLRYNIENNVLRIEVDTPYSEAYQLDFVNVIRNNKTNYKVKVGLDSSSGGSGGSSIGSGSSTEIDSEQKDDLWNVILADIKQMIESTTYPKSNVTPYVSINKQAGILNVLTTSKVHKDIRKYIAKVKNSVSSQALIEAKIVEITLSDEYKTGINWNMLDRQGRVGGNISFDPIGDFTSNAGSFTLGVLNAGGARSATKRFSSGTSDSLISAVSLMEMFGTTRTLSSPRVHAMNNQQAILSFAKNHVYFKLNIEQQSSGTGADNAVTDTKVTSDLKTVPIGLILAIQPTINTESNEITMVIRPTISRIVDQKNDPSIIYALESTNISADNLTTEVPVVEVKELDSVVKIKSGEVMVIGGMMEERMSSNEGGIPGMKEIPFFGNMFKSNGKIKSTIQTVIFLKATIIPGSGSTYSDSDKDFYNTFTNDPNPLQLR